MTVKSRQKESVYSINIINTVHNDDLIHNSVKQFWEYEECINGNNQETAISMNDIRFLKKLTKKTTFTKDKYEVPISWKNTCEELPDN